MKKYGYTEEELRNAKSVIITHPYFGSLYMRVERLSNGYIEGLVWDGSERGSPYLPDDYYGEYNYMNFPISCVREASSIG